MKWGYFAVFFLCLSAGIYGVESVYDQKWKFIDINGNEIALSEFQGDVLLIVNTASDSGFSDQLDSMQFLHKQFASFGLSILAFPCNDFGNQEPRDQLPLKAFYKGQYGVSFPLFSKVSVVGEEALPFFKFLTKEVYGGELLWNFSKILVNRKGEVVKRFPPWLDPKSQIIVKKIGELLKQRS